MIPQETVKKAYNLIMSGMSPAGVRIELNLTEKDWHAINMSSYYHRLLKTESTKETRILNNIKYIRGLELTLLNIIDRHKLALRGSPEKARFYKLMEELSMEYSQYSIYN